LNYKDIWKNWGRGVTKLSKLLRCWGGKAENRDATTKKKGGDDSGFGFTGWVGAKNRERGCIGKRGKGKKKKKKKT